MSTPVDHKRLGTAESQRSPGSQVFAHCAYASIGYYKTYLYSNKVSYITDTAVLKVELLRNVFGATDVRVTTETKNNIRFISFHV